MSGHHDSRDAGTPRAARWPVHVATLVAAIVTMSCDGEATQLPQAPSSVATAAGATPAPAAGETVVVADFSVTAGVVSGAGEPVLTIGAHADDYIVLVFPELPAVPGCLDTVQLAVEVVRGAPPAEVVFYAGGAAAPPPLEGQAVPPAMLGFSAASYPPPRALVGEPGHLAIDVLAQYRSGRATPKPGFALVIAATDPPGGASRAIEFRSGEAGAGAPTLSWAISDACR